jgi:glycosyltransferase involved in cell wall biosynthesis
MNIYLIEPYLTGSHRSWAEGYARTSRHKIELVSLPGYFWKWRMHGSAVTLAPRLRAAFAGESPPDLLLVTDMIDVTTLLSLLRDVAGQVPVAYYFHENQRTYPPPPGTKRDLHYGWINYVSSLASDRIYFNSRHHLDEWYDELPRLLKHFPDHNNLETIDVLRGKSSVLHPGVDLSALDMWASYPGIAPRGSRDEPPLILWNHRWEFDKKPEHFFALLERVEAMGLPFRLAVAGESFRNQPAEFLEARERFRERIVHFGYATPEQYRALLQRSDIVISTAIHEFFGIATVEAVYAGCYPLLPDRLSYPELIPTGHHQSFLYRNFGDALQRLRKWLAEGVPSTEGLRHEMARFGWKSMAPLYDRELEALAQRKQEENSNAT